MENKSLIKQFTYKIKENQKENKQTLKELYKSGVNPLKFLFRRRIVCKERDIAKSYRSNKSNLSVFEKHASINLIKGIIINDLSGSFCPEDIKNYEPFNILKTLGIKTTDILKIFDYLTCIGFLNKQLSTWFDGDSKSTIETFRMKYYYSLNINSNIIKCPFLLKTEKGTFCSCNWGDFKDIKVIDKEDQLLKQKKVL